MIVPGYILTEKLAYAGLGDVYRAARDIQDTDDNVYVEIVRPPLGLNSGMLEFLLREIELGRQCLHPGLIAPIELQRNPRQLLVLNNCQPGNTCADLKIVPSVEVTAAIIVNVAEVLEALREICTGVGKGFAHLPISLKTLIVCNSGELRVFGLGACTANSKDINRLIRLRHVDVRPSTLSYGISTESKDAARLAALGLALLCKFSTKAHLALGRVLSRAQALEYSTIREFRQDILASTYAATTEEVLDYSIRLRATMVTAAAIDAASAELDRDGDLDSEVTMIGPTPPPLSEWPLGNEMATDTFDAVCA